MRSIFFILASVALATSSMAKGSSTSSTITPQSKGDSTNTSTSSTMSSTSASSSTTPTPTYTPPTVSLPTVTPNPSITSSSYLDLTKKVPTILQHAIAISNVSWELGTLTEALLEVYNPSLTPFAWDPSCFNTDVPDAMIQVTLAALADYNWTGAPNTCSGHLPEYLNPDTAPVPLRQQAFVQDLALGDPNSLGTAVWVLAKLAKRDDVREQYGLRESADYAWAVGNQLEHTRQGNTSANGTISQREGYFELWSDMGAMIPPFPAYLGLSTHKSALLNFSITQWTLEASAFLDPTVNLYTHINNFDARFWATGHGWMMWGAMRMLESISAAGRTKKYSYAVDAVKTQLESVFTALFAQLDDDNLLPDYMLQSNATLTVVSAYYRFLKLCPEQTSANLTASAGRAFEGVVSKIGSDGWMTQVVNGVGVFDNLVHLGENLRSPEAQSFAGIMWAARTAAGC